MHYQERTISIITGEKNLDILCEFKSFPVFIGCTEEKIEHDIFADMVWMICRDSGMIQLKNILPAEMVYSAYHSEGIGNIWNQHYEDFCQFIDKYSSRDVLEIGGSNGCLAKKYYSNKDRENKWTIVEPNPGIIGNEKITVIKGFFNENTRVDNVHSIIHSHVLEHLIDPNILLKHIYELLPDNGYHIFSIPNLLEYLRKKQSNSINFEHTYFLTEYFTDFLLQKNGFSIVEKKFYLDHSIFYATIKRNQGELPKLKNYYKENRKLYLSMVEFYDAEVKRLNTLIDEFNGKIFLFGAHIFSQFLNYRGLNTKQISNVLDNSKIKINKRLYGTNLIVNSPNIIQGLKNVAVILKAGQYQEEVKKQLKEINSNVIIWE